MPDVFMFRERHETARGLALTITEDFDTRALYRLKVAMDAVLV